MIRLALPARALGTVVTLVGSLVSALTPTMAFGASEGRLLASQVHLAARLIDELGKQASDATAIVSPAGVGGILAGIEVGSDPISRHVIANILQSPEDDGLPSELEALRTATATAKDDNFTSATRLIFSPSAPPTEAAKRKLSSGGIPVSVEDFNDPRTVAGVNAWADEVTHGKIKQVMSGPVPDLRFAALSFLYFKGQWKFPFQRGETAPADFNTAAGRRITASFMHTRPISIFCREDDAFVAADLPFGGGRFSFVVLTTKGAASTVDRFTDHLPWLSGQGFQPRNDVIVDMPRFQAKAKIELEPVLSRFAGGVIGPFPGLTDVRAPTLNSVTQAVDLSLDEEGAEVAVVTGGFELQGGLKWSDAYDVLVDKPFAFALRDKQTGLIVAAGFVATVDGPVLAIDSPLRSARSRAVMTEAEKARLRLPSRTSAPMILAPKLEGESHERYSHERDF